MDVLNSNGLEHEPDHVDNNCNSTISFETIDVSSLEMTRDSSRTSLGSRQSEQEQTTGNQRLNLATDVVLIIFAIVIIVSCFISVGLFIFGQYRINTGLEEFEFLLKAQDIENIQ